MGTSDWRGAASADVGGYTSIAVRPDGLLALISYFDLTNGDMMVAR